MQTRCKLTHQLRPTQNFLVNDHRQIHSIGNLMVWYFSTLAACSVVRGFLVLAAKRGYRDLDSSGPFLVSFPDSALTTALVKCKG